jgi:hypothetical protein
MGVQGVALRVAERAHGEPWPKGICQRLITEEEGDGSG